MCSLNNSAIIIIIIKTPLSIDYVYYHFYDYARRITNYTFGWCFLQRFIITYLHNQLHLFHYNNLLLRHKLVLVRLVVHWHHTRNILEFNIKYYIVNNNNLIVFNVTL